MSATLFYGGRIGSSHVELIPTDLSSAAKRAHTCFALAVAAAAAVVELANANTHTQVSQMMASLLAG